MPSAPFHDHQPQQRQQQRRLMNSFTRSVCEILQINNRRCVHTIPICSYFGQFFSVVRVESTRLPTFVWTVDTIAWYAPVCVAPYTVATVYFMRKWTWADVCKYNIHNQIFSVFISFSLVCVCVLYATPCESVHPGALRCPSKLQAIIKYYPSINFNGRECFRFLLSFSLSISLSLLPLQQQQLMLALVRSFDVGWMWLWLWLAGFGRARLNLFLFILKNEIALQTSSPLRLFIALQSKLFLTLSSRANEAFRKLNSQP